MKIIKELKVGETFPINEKLAGLVPMACRAEQNALTTSIMEEGLTEPVVLWQGRVVDGRCRSLACITAGVPIRGRDLDDMLTEDEVAIYVKTANTRRNLTMAQKIMVASKEHAKPESKSIAEISKSWAISTRILVLANYISKKRPEFVEPLFNGEVVPIKNKDGIWVETNKISAIHAFIKREEEEITEEETCTWSADLHIETQAGRDFFFEFIKESNTKSAMVFEPIAFWINANFKDKSKEEQDE